VVGESERSRRAPADRVFSCAAVTHLDCGGLRHPDPLPDDHPGCGLIWGVEQNRSQSRKPSVQRSEDIVAFAEGSEVGPIIVE
jgi:hypothetical protein